MSFQFLVFGDLHVNSATLPRALRVLRLLGDAAHAKGVPIVCLGDFWDARGVLATRHVDAVLGEIERWREHGVHAIFVPGNHDQVTTNGRIHGLRIFDPFPNVIVATERILDTHAKIAFVPWRDDAQDQGAQYLLDGEGWTIFGHAEVSGAVANNGSVSPGRVSLAQIQRVSRACYLGHYHLRQRLGDRTWYIGSPFQLHFGERDQAKGVAFVTSDSVDPEFITLPGFPKHLRVDLRAPVAIPMEPHDILEVIAERRHLDDPEVQRWIASLPVQDVRIRRAETEATPIPPPMASTVDAAIAEWASTSGADPKVGEEILSAVRHRADKAESMGTRVEIMRVNGRDFCGLRGPFSLDFEEGPLLLRGRQGAGKTALVDALSWTLYGKTSPRRPGADTASLRGDEVIHDDADATTVTVVVRVDGNQDVEITRTKSRGKGDRASILGRDMTGVSDENAEVERVIGIPYTLWRTCVSLGQGAVANWLTSTDKSRKDLLVDGYGLGVLGDAQKEAKGRAAALRPSVERARKDRDAAQGALDWAESQRFDEQIQRWEESRETKIRALEVEAENCAATIEANRTHIAKGDAVMQRLEEIEDEIILLERELSEAAHNPRREALQKAFTEAATEKTIVEKNLSDLRHKHAHLVGDSQGRGSVNCPTCGQRWERAGVDHHLADIEAQITSKAREISNLESRMSNAALEADGLAGSTSGAVDQVRNRLKTAREQKTKLDEAVRALNKLRANTEAAEARARAVETQRGQVLAEANPYAEQSEKHAKEVEHARTTLANAEMLLDATEAKERDVRKWIEGFGPKGVPVVVLRSAISDLESTANTFLSRLTDGRIWAELTLADDALDVSFREYDAVKREWSVRRHEQLSGGQRRCAELAFSPFGLSEMFFRRLRCKVPFLVIDELTTHLGQIEKKLAADIVHALDRRTVVVIDHDMSVQAEFETIYDVERTADGQARIERSK